MCLDLSGEGVKEELEWREVQNVFLEDLSTAMDSFRFTIPERRHFNF